MNCETVKDSDETPLLISTVMIRRL